MKAEILTLVRNLSSDELIQALFQMAERHPETFDTVLFQKSPEKVIALYVPFSDTIVHFSNQEYAELKALGTRSDKKVTGIKRVREITGIGLKEAKDLYEASFHDPVVQPDTFGIPSISTRGY